MSDVTRSIAALQTIFPEAKIIFVEQEHIHLLLLPTEYQFRKQEVGETIRALPALGRIEGYYLSSRQYLQDELEYLRSESKKEDVIYEASF